jgi:hypothetical protein
LAVVATLSKGYDLDYIWKHVDRGATKDAASYYIQASENGGEPPGRWWGPGAKALGLEPGQRVEREPYELLFGERQAPDGTPLGRRRTTAPPRYRSGSSWLLPSAARRRANELISAWKTPSSSCLGCRERGRGAVMGIALLLSRTIRTQRYRTQQTAKPQQDRRDDVTPGAVPEAGTGRRSETRVPVG